MVMLLDTSMSSLWVMMMMTGGIALGPLGGMNGLEWKIVPDDFVYACAGGRVTLPWSFKIGAQESLLTINWIHDGAVASSLVATMVHDHFVVATFAYSGRLRYVGRGGLTLDDLSSDDSGNYTIEVKVTGAGLYRSFQNTVYLQVGDRLMLKGGQLQAGQDPEAWLDQGSQQWFIRLTCGPFTFLGQPSMDVVWTSPDGETRASSGYESGHFYLSLHTPVLGGNYSCSILPARLSDLCYRGEGGPQNGVALTSHVTVDELKARLSMLEANQGTLREKNARMKERVRILEDSHEQELKNETEACENRLRQLQDQMDQVEADHLYMQEKVEVMRNKSMYVDLSGPCSPDNHKVLNDAWRSTKEGNDRQHCDKSLDAGWYRFFLNGENAIIPFSCVPENRCHTHASTWVDLRGQPVPAAGQEVEARACSHWSSDCCNWVVTITVRNCGPYFVYRLKPLSNCQLAYCVEPQN